MSLTAITTVAHAGDGEVGELTSSGLRWPTDASRILTSTFCEYRPDRFHAGIDFSTHGGDGYECFAVDDGYVLRIRVEHDGYGKVLYLQLDDGRVAVYAHLSRFADEIEEKVRELQLERGGYEVGSFFSSKQFRYLQGEVIAYTGDTGAGAPHLHFEMRRGIDYPYNPSIDGFLVDDDRSPVIRKLALRPLDGDSEVEGDMLTVIRNVRKGRANPVSFYGRVGVSLQAHDFKDGTWYWVGYRRLELIIDGELRHVTSLDSFDYRYDNYSRLDFDYQLDRRGYKDFRRLYVEPPNRLEFYGPRPEGGVLDSRELGPGPHLVQVRVEDDAGNERTATWILQAQSQPSLPRARGEGPPRYSASLDADSCGGDFSVQIVDGVARILAWDLPGWTSRVELVATAAGVSHTMVPYGTGHWMGRAELPLDFRGINRFRVIAFGDSGEVAVIDRALFLSGFHRNRAERWILPDKGIEVRIGKGALWFDMVMSLSEIEPDPQAISPVYAVRPFDHPFAGLFTVAFHSSGSPWPKEAGVCYRERTKGGRWTYIDNRREAEGYIIAAKVYSLEDFAVLLDTVPPVIGRATLSDGARTRLRRPRLAAAVKDTLSGLDLDATSFDLDGENVIWKYDKERDLISYIPWEDLPKGVHRWRIVARDKVGNSTTLERSFRVR